MGKHLVHMLQVHISPGPYLPLLCIWQQNHVDVYYAHINSANISRAHKCIHSWPDIDSEWLN